MKLVTYVSLALALSGCASTITAVKGRPVAAHELKPRFITMTGERRVVVFMERKDDNDKSPRLAWCGESLPDAATALNSSSAPTIVLPNGVDAKTVDSFATSLMKTYDRSPVSDVFRQATFYACSTWLSGGFTTPEYKEVAMQLIGKMEEAAINLSKAPLEKPKEQPPAATLPKCAEGEKNTPEKPCK